MIRQQVYITGSMVHQVSRGAGDVSVGHRALGPDLVADAGAGEIRKVGIGLIKVGNWAET